MSKKHKPKKNFEFLLTIDDSVIIQRFFKADVINDIDYKELNICAMEICEDIINILNEKSIKYNQLHTFNIKSIDKQTKYDYKLEIVKIDNVDSVISQIVFSGGFYWPKVRYNVNIKSETVEYLRKIKQILEK